MKTLIRSEGKKFHKLIMPLLMYVYDRAPEENFPNHKETYMIPDSGHYAAQYLWRHTELIDDYLNTDQAKRLNRRERAKIEEWKKAVYGDFALVETNINGGILVHIEDEKVYLVKGIVSTWEEMTIGLPLPVIFEGGIVPYGTDIVTDGLQRAWTDPAPAELKNKLNRIYENAGDHDEIIRTL